MKTYLLKNKDEAVLSFNAGREKSCDELFISDIKIINDKWLVAAEQFIKNNAKYALHFAGYDRSELVKVDECSLHPLILKDIAALTKAHELKNECDIEKWQYALQSTLNVFQYSRRISGEVADFLRAKYLGLYYNGIEAQNIAYAFENLDKNS